MYYNNDHPARFKRRETHLHILVNNAGVMATPYRRTSDGVELQWSTNHFGHWLLTTSLMDIMKASAPARIINVASRAHAHGRFLRNEINPTERSYEKWRVYKHTKAANVLFTRELARRLRGTGVTANCVYPGVANTGITRHLNPIMTTLVPLKMFYKTAYAAAQNTLYLALEPGLEQVNGKYFEEFHMVEVAEHCRDDDMARWLWRESESITAQVVQQRGRRH